MAPVAAVLGRRASADDRAQTVQFVYRRNTYRFGTQPFYMENGERVELRFRPKFVNGTLFFPVDFLCSFFHWRQIFRDGTGLVILSNRKQIFNRELEGPFIRVLNAELTLQKPGGRQVIEDLRRRWEGSSNSRLLLSREAWTDLRRAVKTGEYAALLFDKLKTAYGKKSESFRQTPVFEGAAALGTETATLAANRILSFGALWRLTGDKAFFARANAEIEALAAADWQAKEAPAPAALAAVAVALYYDWSRQSADEASKMRMERVLLRSFLRPVLETYGERTILWRTSAAVCAQVYQGLSAAAFILSDVFPETAVRAMERILSGLPNDCLSLYAPDGGFAEGAAAWQTTTAALAGTLAMFRSACGSTYGMEAMPGFLQTAFFGTAIETSRGAWDPQNWDATRLNTPFLAWFSAFGNDLPARLREEEVTSGKKQPDVFDLLYWSARKTALGIAKEELPPDAVYRRAGLAVLREGWDEEAMILSLRGGSNAFDGVADAGAFGLDCEGKTFFTGACALLSQKSGQNPAASAALLQAKGAADRAFAVVDTGEALAGAVKRGKRGAALLSGRKIAVVRDELTVSEPTDLVWTAYTPATVKKMSHRTLILEQEGKQLLCRIFGTTGGWNAEDAGNGLTKLTIPLRVQAKLHLSVACRAISQGEDPNENFYIPAPMSTWEK